MDRREMHVSSFPEMLHELKEEFLTFHSFGRLVWLPPLCYCCCITTITTLTPFFNHTYALEIFGSLARIFLG
jgi:hypothetical protein